MSVVDILLRKSYTISPWADLGFRRRWGGGGGVAGAFITYVRCTTKEKKLQVKFM